ncbi:MAG: HAD family phosphatase [Bermanella sp.]
MRLGIVFDFDGVLVESLNKLLDLYVLVCNQFNERNKLIDVDLDFKELNGKNIHEISEFISNKYSISSITDEIEVFYNSRLLDIYNDMVIESPILDLIMFVKSKGIEMSIASGCDTHLIERVLINHGIDDIFNTVIGGDKVEKAKPNPGIINTCLKYSGWDTAILIDDSNNGIASGLAAGCRVIKYDEYTKNNIKNILLQSIENNYSFLGRFNNLNFFEIGIVSEKYSILDENEWALLEANGSYCDVTYHVNPQDILVNNTISVYRSNYKNFRVGITPPLLAVTGLVSDNRGYFLCAERSSVNYQNTGCWDLIPSGSLAVLDYIEQLKTEWLEESSSNIDLEWKEEVSVIYDHTHNVIDILLSSDNNRFDVSSMSSQETNHFMWIDIKRNTSLPIAGSAAFITSLMEGV